MNWDYMDALEQLLNRQRHGGRNGSPQDTATGYNTYSPDPPYKKVTEWGEDFRYPSRAGSVARNRNLADGLVRGGNTYSPTDPSMGDGRGTVFGHGFDSAEFLPFDTRNESVAWHRMNALKRRGQWR